MTTIRHNPRSTRPIVVTVDDCIIKTYEVHVINPPLWLSAFHGSRNGVQPYRLSKLYREYLPVFLFWGLVGWGWLTVLVKR